MDPVTVIGLVVNIFTLVDFASEIVKGARDIYASSSGCMEQNRQREVITREAESLASKLLVTNNVHLTGADKSLFNLATECQKISRDLISLLDKTKAENPKSKFHSAKSAVKNMWYQKDKQDLEQRLQSCRSQLELQLSYLESQNIKEKLGSLVNSSTEEISRLKKLQDDVSRIRGWSVSSFGAAAQAELRGLLRVPRDVLTEIAQERVLGSLRLDGLHARYETVPEAHSKTFEWVIDDHDNPSLAEDRRFAWKKLNTWLSSGNGIFHISGKLGSGKSTLMKFLSSHPNTMANLEEWADDRTLLFAHFFFWKPGTPLQKSLAGLCRGLLHDVLRTCPELIPRVLYNVWGKASTTPWQVQLASEIPDCEIFEGFNHLIGLGSVSARHCFCFFIDGLDEFEENAHHDHRDLVSQLCKWSEVASGNIKLCVSSREHSVFMNNFASEKRLRLHELTRQDMIAFCQDRLGHLVDEDKQRLVDRVVEKAQGIFLWVALVIGSIRRLWEDGASIAELEAEIDLLPDELFRLYEHILDSLGKTMRHKFYQTVAILRLARIYKIRLSLLRYSLLEDYDRDPEFAMAEHFPQEDIHITPTKREERGLRRLNGFKGLLEPDSGNEVDFCHRSVDEFLRDSDRLTNMKNYLGSFNAPDALSHILLGDLRLGPTSTKDEDGWERDYSLSTGLLCLRVDHELDKPPYSFLSFLDNIHGASLWDSISSEVNYGVGIWTHEAYMIYHIFSPSRPLPIIGLDPHISLTAPIFVLTCLGYHEYPVWKICRDAIATSNAIILAYCDLLCDCVSEYSTRVKGVSVLETLLERGALSPNDVGFNIYSSHAVMQLWSEPHNVEQMSLWHNVLATIYLAHENCKRKKGRQTSLSSDYVCLYNRVLRLLLERKPDLHFSMALNNDKEDQRKVVRMNLGLSAEPCSFTIMDYDVERPFAYPSLRSFLESSKLKDKEALVEIYDAQLNEERNARDVVTSLSLRPP
ncbi:hypothetical protein AOR_1_590144 [Paecilomyces variotii No. 5]|uniref:Nephrocystin 3-like N-terminal domain-containing protein n=1 Tax=Byssochlamys spectabilis (strain No. 5 / NBRC 109023) TaxID=1356009 RepID=V5I3H6_BYSSN|nr:hypothetical protein AOR_1_590144 [Paecilomyces variotii No. 5]